MGRRLNCLCGALPREYAVMRLGRVHRQATSPHPGLRQIRDRLRVAEPARPDHLARDRRRTQAISGLAGETECWGVNNVGEPCAGEPHAWFDGRGLETEHDTVSPRQLPTLRGVSQPAPRGEGRPEQRGAPGRRKLESAGRSGG